MLSRAAFAPFFCKINQFVGCFLHFLHKYITYNINKQRVTYIFNRYNLQKNGIKGIRICIIVALLTLE